MALYPIIFKFTQPVRCDSFSAVVVGEGRALIELEDGAWWCHGVEPGGLTANGESPQDAYRKFRESIGWIIGDFASEALSFERFEDRVKNFMADEDAAELDRWKGAVEQVRTGLRVEEPFAQMERRSADSELAVRIELRQVFANEQLALAA